MKSGVSNKTRVMQWSTLAKWGKFGRKNKEERVSMFVSNMQTNQSSPSPLERSPLDYLKIRIKEPRKAQIQA